MKRKRSKHQFRNPHIEVAAEKTVNHRLFSVEKPVRIVTIRIILVKTVQQEIRKTATILVTLAGKIASIVLEIIPRDVNQETTVEDTVVKIVQNVGVHRSWNHRLTGV